ncbi:carbohydrate ABC transporter permease [Leifsonia sp. NPDC058194]|uniref:carbohydrate ABC transporter permease n=1 Tax=Leifsonia sp. NPDC058194 TaxID=3346374 RepID=UPI0036DA09CB
MFRYTKLTFVREIIVVAIAVAMLVPFYLLVVTSTKSDSDTLTSPPMSFTNPSLNNFFEAWNAQGQRSLAAGMLNSAIITVGSVIILIAFGSIAAYVIARSTARWSKAASMLFLIGIILPFQLGMIPAYSALRTFGLVGSPVGLIILYSGLMMPLTVFLYLGFAREIPREYEEAATIDGASRFSTFRRIIFPLLSPATGTVAILCGLIIWNDFFTQLIFLSGSGSSTLPVVIYSYVGSLGARWNVIFAAIIISMIPILVFYLFAQRKFIQGFAGGIKS